MQTVKVGRVLYGPSAPPVHDAATNTEGNHDTLSQSPPLLFRSPLHDLFLVPITSTTNATGLRDGKLAVTLASPMSTAFSLKRRATETSHPSTVQVASPTLRLSTTFVDARCPSCGPSSVVSSLSELRGASMMRCDHCLICPRCRLATAKVQITASQKAALYCPNCSWRTPKFPSARELSLWLGVCTQSLLRTVCGFTPPMPHHRAAVSSSTSFSNAATAERNLRLASQPAAAERFTFTAATEEVDIPKIRAERVLAFEAAVSSQRVCHESGVASKQHITNALLSVEGRRGVPQQSRSYRLSTTEHVPFSPPASTPIPHRASAQTSADATVSFSDGFVFQHSSHRIFMSHIDPSGAAASPSPESPAAAGDEVESARVELPPALPMQRTDRLARTRVVASSSSCGSSVASADPSPVSPCGAFEAAGCTSSSAFTSASSSAELATSLNAARFLPFVSSPTNMTTRHAIQQAETAVFLSLQCICEDSRIMVHGVTLEPSLLAGGEYRSTCGRAFAVSLSLDAARRANSGDRVLSGNQVEAVPVGTGSWTLVRGHTHCLSKLRHQLFVDDTIAGIIFGPTHNEEPPSAPSTPPSQDGVPSSTPACPPAGYFAPHVSDGGPLIFGLLLKEADAAVADATSMGAADASLSTRCVVRPPAEGAADSCEDELWIPLLVDATIANSKLFARLKHVFDTPPMDGVRMKYRMYVRLDIQFPNAGSSQRRH